MSRESIGHTFKIAFLLCVVCSVVVSAAAVVLRPRQDANKEREIRKNILIASGVLTDPDAPAKTIDRLASEKIERHLIDLRTGLEVDPENLPQDLNIANIDEYDQRTAIRDPKLSTHLTHEQAIHGIQWRENYSFVYRVEHDGEKLIVLPVYGAGLWSTLYGFLALSPDTKTIAGLTFYEHGETPGLGGEVDNPAWKAQWIAKQPFNDDWDIEIEVTKPGRAIGISQVDGIAGATITSRGVENLLRFWLGDLGFGPYLERIRATPGHTSPVSETLDDKHTTIDPADREDSRRREEGGKNG